MSGKTLVQNTNLSCIISKWSANEKGYFVDPFLKYLTEKVQKRSPLINRGYYIRAQAIDRNLRRALQNVPQKEYQIISIGAGFDTTFFRLKSEKVLSSECCYYEIDFKPVLEQKLGFIMKHEELKILTGEIVPKEDKNIVFSSRNFVLLSGDLYDLKDIELTLLNANLDFTVPTILFSECVLNYMQACKADAILKWAAEKFRSAYFITYEQICAEDGFGHAMMDHFTRIGSPLLSITNYPDVETQKNRFLHLGWKSVEVNDLNTVYECLGDTEKARISMLEPFDEFEEFHLKCSHYILATARKGWPESPNLLYPVGAYHPVTYQERQIDWKTVACPNVSRFGHSAVWVTKPFILLSGGFGHHETGHKRLHGLHLVNLYTGEHEAIELNDPGKLLGERLFHQLVALQCGCLLVTGGRASPSRALNCPLVFLVKRQTQVQNASSAVQKSVCLRHSHLHVETQASESTKEQTLDNTCDHDHRGCTGVKRNCVSDSRNSNCNLHHWTVGEVNMAGDPPGPRWRHSATYFVNQKGEEKVLVFGGYNHEKHTIGDCYLLNIRNFQWIQVDLTVGCPGPRHSHSCVLWNGNIWLSGGLSSSQQALADIYAFNITTEHWSCFELKHPIFSRYSHTSHVWNNCLYLIGGVSTSCIPSGSPGIAEICLESGRAWELRLKPPVDLQPLLLFKHASFYDEEDDSVWIVGGGGNCFSFGTAFNKDILKMRIK